ncbi:DUF2608 domain-containing protein [Escherichia coli]|nr:DUF2608 domain-containing protein [Escherichia coli]
MERLLKAGARKSLPMKNEFVPLLGTFRIKHGNSSVCSDIPCTGTLFELRELKRNGIDFSSSASGRKRIFDPLKKGTNGHGYSQGVFFLREDKGVILDYMLDKMGNKYDAIVFIDDGQANIHAMTKMFSKDKWFSTDFTFIYQSGG